MQITNVDAWAMIKTIARKTIIANANWLGLSEVFFYIKRKDSLLSRRSSFSTFIMCYTCSAIYQNIMKNIRNSGMQVKLKFDCFKNKYKNQIVNSLKILLRVWRYL